MLRYLFYWNSRAAAPPGWMCYLPTTSEWRLKGEMRDAGTGGQGGNAHESYIYVTTQGLKCTRSSSCAREAPRANIARGA
eukprot:3859323-Pleurochrysis_carterae.AAC.6